MVKAVCEVPYGAHPAGMPNCGLPDFEHYFDDYEFLTDSREASRDDRKFSEWIKYWVLDCSDHNEYLAKLGRDRILYLKGKAHSDSWRNEMAAEMPNLDFDKGPNPLEKLVVVAARIISDKLVAGGYKTILAGVGLPHLAGWLATYRLKETGYAVDLMAEIGMFGYLPRASDPFIFSYHNMHACKILSNNETMLGVFVGGSSNRCLGVLGGGQIDKYGNGNSTKLPGIGYLVGSGGSNDIANGNRETVAVVNSGKQRLVEEVPYVTFSGKNVKTLVTEVGTFEKIGGEESFTLTSYIPSRPRQRAEEAVAEIGDKVGWELKVSPNLAEAQPVAKEEVTLLRLFDPKGFYT
jgi:acyl CoA:acetate/3-ketoacid CoA transferase beta subunit